MIRLLAIAVLLLVGLPIAQAGFFGAPNPLFTGANVAPPANFDIDCGTVGSTSGCATGFNGAGGSVTLSNLSTASSSGLVIMCYVVTISGSGSSVTSPNLTFTQRGFAGSGPSYVVCYSAPYSSALSNEAITFNQGGATVTYFAGSAFAVATGAAFDADASLPATANSGATVNVTTSNSTGDFIYTAVNTHTSPDTPLNSMTAIYNSNFFMTAYILKTTTVSGFAVGGSDTNGFATFGDAVKRP